MIFAKERMEVIEYIGTIGSTAVRFVFREPPLAYLTNIFTLPFTKAVWLAILICVLGCAVFLYIASKWEASMSMVSAVERGKFLIKASLFNIFTASNAHMHSSN